MRKETMGNHLVERNERRIRHGKRRMKYLIGGARENLQVYPRY